MLRRAVFAIGILLGPGIVWAAPSGAAPAPTAAKASKAIPLGPGKGPSASALAMPAGKKTKKVSRYAPVELYQINTKETLMLRFHDDRGKPIKGWQKRFDKFMRCHHTGSAHKMDPRLAQMLYQTGRHFDGRRMEVVSGYRHPRVARNPRSPHKEGVACDFRIRGVGNASLRDYLRKTFDHAGVGYYPNSTFVHLDNRKNGPSAFWVDYSGPGEEANYAENPDEVLRGGRGDPRSNDASGRGEAEALAGLGAKGRPRPKTGSATSQRQPIEVKPSDPFGD